MKHILWWHIDKSTYICNIAEEILVATIQRLHSNIDATIFKRTSCKKLFLLTRAILMLVTIFSNITYVDDLMLVSFKM